MIEVLLNNETDFDVPTESLKSVVKSIVADHGFSTAEISLAVIDDDTMHRLNRDHLQHDYPTDVLSFVLANEVALEGEVIVSSETAQAIAAEYDWDAQSELLLYFIHGALHLVGYDDHNSAERQKMRERESHYLRSIRIEPPACHSQRALQDQEAGE